ncbi:class I SAM-dependent methyltransferase [Pyrobaculum neutrophilum]|uniref:Methyltransferase type 11 n=1 Tax=Pyrobaculum neutrophilum (strain DSM 2338 / JCM 9278 / NBRC 100436 / V24Sta) TaxID=444157 RepID=B1YB73_PYRNV|nr:class I SAM-dependent methyltransferase [Pyrobaculum neutrophilum]ACB39204.1 Methyltransferase type 11 [Pyrobaculum neutrophilum V24Sta]
MIEEIARDLEAFDLGESVLEVGAGYGSTTALLLRRGLRVCAVDIDPGAISYLRSAFKDYAEAGLLRAVLAPGESLPFKDGECDSAVSVAALHHIRDIAAALREMLRVARRLVVVYDWTPESAGVTNPHSAQELDKKMREAAAAAEALGYDLAKKGLWYRLTKRKT